jgi:pinin/SDK/memA/ protein conserved region
MADIAERKQSPWDRPSNRTSKPTHSTIHVAAAAAAPSSNGEPAGAPAKRRRVLSSAVAVGGAEPRSADSFAPLTSARDPPLSRGRSFSNGTSSNAVPLVEPAPRPNRLNDATKSRDRRFLGGIMAHLGLAKQQLSKDKDRIEKQARVEQTAVSKQLAEAARLRQLASQLVTQRRNAQLARQAEATAQIKIEERAKVTELWLAVQEPLRNVLVTKAGPPLAWLPAEHNETTLVMLDIHKADWEALVQAKRAEDTAFADQLDAQIEARYPGARAAAVDVAAPEQQQQQERSSKRSYDDASFDDTFNSAAELSSMPAVSVKSSIVVRRGNGSAHINAAVAADADTARHDDNYADDAGSSDQQLQQQQQQHDTAAAPTDQKHHTDDSAAAAEQQHESSEQHTVSADSAVAAAELQQQHSISDDIVDYEEEK